MQYVPKKQVEGKKETVDKGKQIVIDVDHGKDHDVVINGAGPSNSKLLSVKTIINRDDFPRVNNVPMHSKEASDSVGPLLGFIYDDPPGTNVIPGPQSSPILGVMTDSLAHLQDQGHKDVSDIVSSSVDTLVVETQFQSLNSKQTGVNMESGE